MEKLDMKSKNIISENICNIGRLFPNCIIEGKIDFNALKEELSTELLDDKKEKYQMTWVGKRQAILDANTSINKTLKPIKDKSINFNETKNIYIEGDNLEVLKLLQESYLRKIDVIYIDPPYNTGNDFIYKDNYRKESNEELLSSGDIDESYNRLVTNLVSNGKFHSDWLTMMYPRIKLARNLLKDDGVIFISIDDNEESRLKLLCDEIFGERNFIANIIRNTNSAKNQSLFISVSHEYCLCYAKNIDVLQVKHANNKWGVKKNNVDEYIKRVEKMKNDGMSNEQITEELKKLTNYPRFIDFTNYWYFDNKGLYMKDNLGGVTNGNKEPIMNPKTNKLDPVPPGGFRYSSEKLKQLIEEDRIHFHTDGSLPRLKRYLSENMYQRPKSIMSDDQRPDYSLMKEFNTPFDNPKQLDFMERILSIFDKNSIILDFFAGSSTTAHATMKLNSLDSGNRQFIMVQIPEECSKDSEAYKEGYNTICDIGEERIRKATEKIKNDTDANIDYGFRVYRVNSSNMKDVYYEPSKLNQSQLNIFESNIKEDRTAEDLLTQVILDLGLTLDLKIEEKNILNNKVYFVAENSLVACFDSQINIDILNQICEIKPLKLVFRESSFKNDSDKINTYERIKKLSPETEISVI